MVSPTTSSHVYDQTRAMKQQTESKTKKDGKPPQTLDEVTSMMKKLKLSQVEATKKLNEESAFLRDVFTKTPPKSPYYSPKQYGNREYPPTVTATANPIRGCYWDGQSHLKEDCPDLKRAVERGDVHMRGKIVFLGQERLGDEIKVPIPSEVGGVIKWQKDCVHEYLKMKESDIPKMQYITVETEGKCMACNMMEKMNGENVIHMQSREMEVDEKRVRESWDEGEKEPKR